MYIHFSLIIIIQLNDRCVAIKLRSPYKYTRKKTYKIIVSIEHIE